MATVTRERELLRELVALVRGECPSLLNEDSGGIVRLSMAIDDALAAPPAEDGALTAAVDRVERIVEMMERSAGPYSMYSLVFTGEDMVALRRVLNAVKAQAPPASDPPSHWDVLADVVYELLDADDRTDLLHGTGFAEKLRAALVAPHKPYPLPASPRAETKENE